jgi:hypothetical protein
MYDAALAVAKKDTKNIVNEKWKNIYLFFFLLLLLF